MLSDPMFPDGHLAAARWQTYRRGTRAGAGKQRKERQQCWKEYSDRPTESALRLDATWERKRRVRDGCEIVLGHQKNGATSFEL